jgi:Xaa-Pro aminopeptidase
MRLLKGSWFYLLLCALPLWPSTGVSLDEYRQRRAEFRKLLGNGVFILFGSTEGEHGDLRSPFFQEANFYYLTGWNEPGAALVITPERDLLLIPSRNTAIEKWTGPKAAPGDSNITEVSGFKEVLPVEAFERSLPEWVATAPRVLTITANPRTEALRRMLPLRDVQDASQVLAKLRMKKSPAEIDLIRNATEVGVEAHKAAWKRAAAGVFEYQIAAEMANVYFDRGCSRHAYSPIVGSGANAAVLHYNRNTRRMDAGELLLMDVGPECGMYATDITRTIPISGKFTERQRELYEVVLGAQKAAIAAVKPGALLGNGYDKQGLFKVAMDYINSHGTDKHGEKLGKYFTHGLGHHVGLDVHDPTVPTMVLEPGMVFTIEPGLYLPEEGIGIRIEDVILVTEDGARVLSSSLPREVKEIEQFMAEKKK